MSADLIRHVPILLIDVEGFTSRYPDVESKRVVLMRLQDALTSAARPFFPEGDAWAEWLRHDVGDGYYVVPVTLSPQQALAYARMVGEEVAQSGRLGGTPDIRLRMVLAFGDLESVEDQWLSDAFITARRFIEDSSFATYARERPEPTALVLTDRFHHELTGDPGENGRLPRSEDLYLTPIVIKDKHGSVHRGQAKGPGWERTSEATEVAPPALPSRQREFVEKIFETLASYPILLLLAQEEHEQGKLIATILERARRARGTANVLYATPPYSVETGSEAYFARLGRQCGFREEIRDAVDWDSALDTRLSNGNRLFLVMNGLDNGPATLRRKLAATLRSLLERHNMRLRVVLSGGERLAELKYEADRMSLLNMAEDLIWPELEVADVVDWQRRDFPRRNLRNSEARVLLETTGGHPRSLRYLLHLWERHGALDRESCRAALHEYPFLRELFRSFSQAPGVRARICEWLEQDDLGLFYPWPRDEVLRRLYWGSLLLQRDGRLHWRCDVLRDVGSQVLRCGR